MFKWISAGLTFAAVVFTAVGCAQSNNQASNHRLTTGRGDMVGQSVYAHSTHEMDQAWTGQKPANDNTATASTAGD